MLGNSNFQHTEISGSLPSEAIWAKTRRYNQQGVGEATTKKHGMSTSEKGDVHNKNEGQKQQCRCVSKWCVAKGLN